MSAGHRQPEGVPTFKFVIRSPIVVPCIDEVVEWIGFVEIQNEVGNGISKSLWRWEVSVTIGFR